MELPDRSGREDILRVHTRKTPLGSDVDLAKTAQLTPGMSGADLAGLVNEAAIRAVRRSSSMVTQVDFDLAVKDFFRSRGKFKILEMECCTLICSNLFRCTINSQL